MYLLRNLTLVMGEIGVKQTLNIHFSLKQSSSMKFIPNMALDKCYSSMFSKTLKHSDCKTIQVPQDIMYDVVADVDAYKEFIPWCTKSIVTAQTKKTAKAQLCVGFGPIQEHYNSTLVYNKPRYIKSICSDGRLFNLLDCTWKFAPGKTPSSCVITFDVIFEFRSLMYSRLSKLFFDEVVAKMVSAFERRAKRKYLIEKTIKKT